MVRSCHSQATESARSVILEQCLLAYEEMPDPGHIRGFRLLEHAQTQVSRGTSLLTGREVEHLRHCTECQDMCALFTRQLNRRAPLWANNGETVPIDGYYKNLCCGLELYIAAGKVFPDCRRHSNLPTVWKLLSEDLTSHKPKEGKNKGFAA